MTLGAAACCAPLLIIAPLLSRDRETVHTSNALISEPKEFLDPVKVIPLSQSGKSEVTHCNQGHGKRGGRQWEQVALTTWRLGDTQLGGWGQPQLK